MKKFTFSSLLCLTWMFTLWIDSYAVCNVVYPSAARAKLSVTVSIERYLDELRYKYSLASDPVSERAVEEFGMTAAFGSTSSPSGWKSIGLGPGIFWSAKKINVKLAPGRTLSGFDITAKSIPGLMDYRAITHIDIAEIPNADELPEECADDDTFIRSTKVEFNSIREKTIGPIVPPVDQSVICDTFILDLIGQVREAVTAGWIKHDLRKDRDDDDDHGKRKGDDKGKKKGHEKDDDEGDDNGGDDEMDDADKNLPGVAKSIIKKLTKVRRECLRGKFGNAREKLRALIRQVNAQRGKHLTEEAHSLIKFNAEFLLEKI